MVKIVTISGFNGLEIKLIVLIWWQEFQIYWPYGIWRDSAGDGGNLG